MKKSNEEFKKEVYDLVSDEYEVLENYKGSKIKILFKHKKCNYEFLMKPNNFLSGNRCPKCAGVLKKSTEEFKKEVYDLVGDEYTVLGNYINNNTKIEILHNKCGNICNILPKNFISNGNRCFYCSGKMKKSTEEFKKEVYDLVGNEYEVLSKYINNNTKLKILHNKCSNKYYVTPTSFLSGERCPYCFGLKKKSTEEFKKEVYDLVGDEYTVLGEYKGNMKYILIKHNKCGNEYKTYPNTFLSGKRCLICSGLKKKSTEEFKKEVYNIVNDEYTILGEYINNNTKIEILHNKCGNKYYVRPSDFLQNKRCPYCKQSKGEKKICDYLDKLKIPYKRQVTFKDCKYKNNLKFDFQIITNNNNIIVLIEYDGEFHFKNFFYEENLKNQQIRDEIKNNYCKNNSNIHLYRIKYTEFNNIENILNEIINKEL